MEFRGRNTYFPKQSAFGKASSDSFNPGWYQFTGLASGDTYTVAPTYPCEWSFTPSQAEITIAGADVMEVNFTAVKLRFSIFGVLTDASANPVPYAMVSLYSHFDLLPPAGGVFLASTVTDALGYYSFGALEKRKWGQAMHYALS